ncbi:major facilitator superfamily domain-containing protein [Zychaea mexicana]|uniref:major facilitator superfamily domain-containing protein n=1 Tax=Zychaea mexicana TaxID=64656 RepID=UPI0022FEC6DB|nr:major facilitator superfamily domain-containing protein [Zychaea mexicana]KAI9497361.1 major facilitator superfamily domain-containing protein [Zychaea mexicana]
MTASTRNDVDDAFLKRTAYNITGREENEKKTEFVYSPEEKKLLRKINLVTVPFICVISFIQFLDKYTLNFSAAMGIFEDTKITGNQYSWLGSIYYLGYLAFQFPNQYFLQKIPISKYLGASLILWGITVGCTALAHNFSELAALRFLLGLIESVSYPSLYLLISILYRRTEQVIWLGAIPACNGLGVAFGGLIGLGFLRLDGAHGLRAWRWCMIILGCLTVGVGCITFLFLPDTAKSPWYRLSPGEIDIVDERIRDNAVVQSKTIKFEQIVESLKETRFYCYILISFLNQLVNGCSTFFSTMIIKSMGFSNTQSILLNIPSGIVSILLMTAAIYFSYRFNEICYVGAVMTGVNFCGILLLVTLPISGVMLLGLFLTSTGMSYLFLLALISSNCTGYTKKVFTNSANVAAFCLGNFVGPLLMRQEQAPRYLAGMITYLVALATSIILFLYVRYTYACDNRYRKHLKEENKLLPQVEEREQIDMTDRQDLHFLYRP